MINLLDSTKTIYVMKKTVLFICFVGLLQISAIGQQDVQRAHNYFNRAFYGDAIPLYEEIAKSNKSSAVVKNLADSYYNTYQLSKAAKWFSYLTTVYSENIDESYFFKYSQTLKAIGEYEEATQILMDYYGSKNDTVKVEKLKAELKHLENVDAIGNRFKIENLPLNTKYSEFGAAKVDSTIVYAASKKNAKPILSKVYRWNSENYLDMYAHSVDKLALGDSVSIPFSKNINTKMHEATFAITNDRKTIYFTRNNFTKGKKKTDGNKISNLKIYKAEWIENEWKNITELHFNSDDFSNEHPTLNASNTKMYFASDRPDGYGSFDIYEVSIDTSGKFGLPKNLGKTINTPKKEQFPFIDKDNNLYFSSNGHAGFGLLDIFVSESKNNTFQKPNNAGKPLNGGYDDFAFSVDTEQNGFFASNRPGGMGGDDIYEFKITKPLIIEDCGQFIAGTITDKTTNLPIPFSIVDIYNADAKLVSSVKTNNDASFKFNVDCENQYTIKARKNGYNDNSKNVLTDKVRNSIKDGSLHLISIAEIEKKKAEEQKRIEAEKQRKAQLAEDERIAEEKRLKEKAQKEKEQELVRIERENQQKEQERLKRIENVIKKEPLIEKTNNAIIIKSESKVRFDYDLWYIRLESKEKLDEIVTLLKNNPGIHLEIGTHTDIRGNNRYNRDLSQKRSNSVLEYLVSQGISEKRITAKGYGESKPLVKCETEDSCSEQQHELNRRCEFTIIKWD